MRVFNELLGEEVEVPDRPCRIVSLAEDITETLFMIGAGDRVVGVSSYCYRPSEAYSRTRVGTYYRVSYSRLEKLKPDLILTTSAAQRRVNLELYERGYPVFPIQLPVSVAGVVENVRRVGVLVDETENSLMLAEKLVFKLAELGKSRLTNNPRAYVEIDLGSPITVGQASYVHDMLHILGLRNIYGDVKRAYLEPDFRKVVEYDPDIIIYDPKPHEQKAYQKFYKLVSSRGWDSMRAVKLNRIVITRGDDVAHYGPSLILEIMPLLLSKIKELLPE